MRRLPSYRWTGRPSPSRRGQASSPSQESPSYGDLDPVPWPVGRVTKAAMGWSSSNYWSGRLGRRRTDFLGCFFRRAPGGWLGGCITTSGFKFWAGPVHLDRQLLRASCLRESKFSLMEKKAD
ncbi:LOW QUALITY PROTEIN: hypothetical protein PAHAL_2G351900 [Panicum hallii]|uniref:Uncharacterized protein n=1 Tax=Panicum hallii TaxID=206008 RepID=A0A2T8KRK5_9POAL|nr:LOW QUALITY PROTEIN: hypothetical protein PAHAL_2G351900 [Panicum hallii]